MEEGKNGIEIEKNDTMAGSVNIHKDDENRKIVDPNLRDNPNNIS